MRKISGYMDFFQEKHSLKNFSQLWKLPSPLILVGGWEAVAVKLFLTQKIYYLTKPST